MLSVSEKPDQRKLAGFFLLYSSFTKEAMGEQCLLPALVGRFACSAWLALLRDNHGTRLSASAMPHQALINVLQSRLPNLIAVYAFGSRVSGDVLSRKVIGIWRCWGGLR